MIDDKHIREAVSEERRRCALLLYNRAKFIPGDLSKRAAIAMLDELMNMIVFAPGGMTEEEMKAAAAAHDKAKSQFSSSNDAGKRDKQPQNAKTPASRSQRGNHADDLKPDD